MVGQLINQKVFMAAAALTITGDRELYVNFSKPFDMQPYTFMHKRPQELSKVMMFVDPFTPTVRLFFKTGRKSYSKYIPYIPMLLNHRYGSAH